MTIEEMLDYQLKLQEKNRDVWEGDTPETAQHHLLYAVEEIGEVSAILKKRGPRQVVADPCLRARFCEEMADVFMYLCDVMICCGASGEEFEREYRAKMEKNLGRDFPREHSQYLKDPSRPVEYGDE